MVESLATATKIALPVTLAVSILSLNLSEGEMLIPINNHEISVPPRSCCWEGYDTSVSLTSFTLSEYDRVQAIMNFASKLLSESVDMPSEYANLINKEFWNLL